MPDGESWDWTFLGFETLQGNQPVQDWYEGLTQDERDEANDTIGYLQHSNIIDWDRPHFSKLKSTGGLSEIIFWTPEAFRIYGIFGPNRTYTFLHGTQKKVDNDRRGIRLAKQRRNQLEREEARRHRFKFQKQPNR